MLVLTRKKSQLIQIGDNVVIKVIRTGPGSVKLGIDAPSDVRVLRGELNETLAENYQLDVESTADSENAPSAESTRSSRPNDRVDDEEPVSAKLTSYRNSRYSAV